MNIRLAVICTKGHWIHQAPQSEEKLHEVVVEIPDLEEGWEVQRVMVCEPIRDTLNITDQDHKDSTTLLGADVPIHRMNTLMNHQTQEE